MIVPRCTGTCLEGRPCDCDDSLMSWSEWLFVAVVIFVVLACFWLSLQLP